MNSELKSQPTENRDMNSNDDEIDLFELWDGLVAEWKTVFGMFLFSIFCASIFIFLGAKTYESEAFFLPAFKKDVVVLNIPGVVPKTESELFEKFVEKLASPNMGEMLLNEPDIRALYESKGVVLDAGSNNLLKSIKITLPQASKQKSLLADSYIVQVGAKADTAEKAKLLVERLATIAGNEVKREIKSDVLGTVNEYIKQRSEQYTLENNRINRELSSEIARLKEADSEKKRIILEQIQLLRLKAKQDRLFKLERLEADYALAKKLGITTPINPVDYKKSSKAISNVELSNNATPSRYWLGEKVLVAEINVLKTLQNDDAYIPELSDLNSKLKALDTNHRINTILARKDNLAFSDQLRSIKDQINEFSQAKQVLENVNFAVARTIQNATLPTKPISPKKGLVLAVAGVLGLMLGIFIALIRRAVKTRHQESLPTA